MALIRPTAVTQQQDITVLAAASRAVGIGRARDAG